MSIGRSGAWRRLIVVAVALSVVATACVVVGFMVPPASSTDGLPRSIVVDHVGYQRVHLLAWRMAPPRDIITVQVPATARPIVVRASCRLGVLHKRDALSALMLELPWTRTGGDVAGIPDTRGAEYLTCPPRPGQDLVQTIDPAWLPRNGDQLRMKWWELPTFADAPSEFPASWALAVYIAR